MTDFHAGDAVWINDGYAGAPHAATVISITDDTLWAESAHHLLGDSRVTQWEIRANSVAEMVTPR